MDTVTVARLGRSFAPSGYGVVEAVEALRRGDALALLGAGRDPWVRAALAGGARVHALGLFAVEVPREGKAAYYWPVVYFEVVPRRGGRQRLVSLTVAPGYGDEPVWMVTSFLSLKPDWSLWLGEPSGQGGLVNGDDPEAGGRMRPAGTRAENP